jgi:hypothetical protein
LKGKSSVGSMPTSILALSLLGCVLGASPIYSETMPPVAGPTAEPILIKTLLESADVSPGNDSTSKLEYDGGFDGPLRKERTHEAVEILGRTDCLRDPPG